MKIPRLGRSTWTMLAIVGAGCLVAVLLFVGIYRSQQASRRGYADAVHGLDLIGDLQYYAQEARRTLLYALATTDANRQVEYADQSRAADAKVAQYLGEYRTLVASRENVVEADVLAKDWADYLTVRDALIADMLEGNPKAAVTRDLKDGVTAFHVVSTDLDEAKNLFKMNAGEVLAEVDVSFRKSLLRMALILGTLVALGAVIAKMVQGRTLLRSVQASEARARAAAELFSAVLRAATEYSIIGTNPEGTITVFNEGAERLLGYRAEEAVGALALTAIHDPAEIAARAEKLGIAPGFEVFVSAARRGAAETREWSYVRKDGTQFPVVLTVTAMRDGAGGLTGFIAIATDITERKRSEEELRMLNAQLVETSRHAGMAEVATGVLHNVGNVLNSVNISASIALEKLRGSKVENFAKAAALLGEHLEDIGDFLTKDPQGQRLPGYLRKLSGFLVEENSELRKELDQLGRNIEHIKEIVAMQQSYARVTGVLEDVPPDRLIEDALQINTQSFARHGIHIARQFEPAPAVRVDKHKALQIIINLLRNAKHAVEGVHNIDPRIGIAMDRVNGHVRIRVTDNGVGIERQNMTKIFQHGFTTKKTGHGFGLHSGALAAKEMGGSLSAHSDGPGRGATFTLELPVANHTASS